MRSTQLPIGTISPVSSAIGMNSVGCQQPAVGVSPAQQRLEPDELLGHELDQRLVVQLELVALDRVAQVALDRHPLDQTTAQRGVERLEAPAAELLGAVHRGVRVAQQLLGGPGPSLADGDADAGRDEHLVSVDLKGLDDRVDQALRDFRDRMVGVRASADDA